MKKVTLADIAKKTGYSVNTVSHALRDMKDISKEVKKYINDTAISMGYIPNISAGVLRGGKTKTVAIILDDITSLDNVIYVKEIESSLGKRGYSTFVMNTENKAELSENAVTRALSQNVDGIIFFPCNIQKKSLDLIKENKTPYIFFGYKYQKENYIDINRYESGYLCGEHLLSLGHKKVLFMTKCNKSQMYKETILGIENALKESVKVIATDSSYESIENALNENKDCSAIICECSFLAFKVYSFLKEKEIQVPEELSICAIGNSLQQETIPTALTYAGDLEHTLCTKAVNALFDIIGEEKNTPEIILPVSLFEGETTAQVSPKFKSLSRKQLSDYLL